MATDKQRDVVGSVFYQCGLETIGIVKAKHPGDQYRYFIGVGHGEDKKADEQMIAFWGDLFDPIAGEHLIPAQ